MRIKELRNLKSLTQKEVADAIGGTQSNLAKWEKETVQPSSDFIIRLADFFEVSADYLLGRSDELGYVTVNNKEIALSPTEKKLLDNFRAMRPDIQAYCLSMTETLSQTPESLSKDIKNYRSEY